jgi:hypothetical protein
MGGDEHFLSLVYLLVKHKRWAAVEPVQYTQYCQWISLHCFSNSVFLILQAFDRICRYLDHRFSLRLSLYLDFHHGFHSHIARIKVSKGVMSHSHVFRAFVMH